MVAGARLILVTAHRRENWGGGIRRIAETVRSWINELAPGEFAAMGRRMRQVLINLLSNAVRHGDANALMSLIVTGADGALTIEVKNRGAPVPEDLRQVIFDPLVQIPGRAS